MDAVLLVSQAPNGALSGRRISVAGAVSATASGHPSSKLRHPLSLQSRLEIRSRGHGKPRSPPIATAREPSPSGRTPVKPFSASEDETVFIGDEGVPLEGVIQFDNPSAMPRVLSWAMLALLAGGDLLSLLTFSAIGRLSHGLPIVDFETLKTADPFIAGWVLSAYFLGAYGDDGKGLNGYGTAVAAAGKSWLVGIPLGIVIRAATSGHIPQIAFMLVAMGSTGILLIGWRALVCKVLTRESKRNDVYKRGNPFELFEVTDASSPPLLLLRGLFEAGSNERHWVTLLHCRFHRFETLPRFLATVSPREEDDTSFCIRVSAGSGCDSTSCSSLESRVYTQVASFTRVTVNHQFVQIIPAGRRCTWVGCGSRDLSGFADSMD